MIKPEHKINNRFSSAFSEFFYDQVVTTRGVFVILFSGSGIFRIYLPGSIPREEHRHQRLPWQQLCEDLNIYFAGKMVNWDQYPLDTTGYRPFTAAILDQVRRIPYGRVFTYRETAERAGFPLAWRAAGQALKANRHPIMVPCHRVVTSGIGIGGFSGPPGWKKMLLELERDKKI